MKKNLIALAVSTAFALPAMADVAVGPFSIYGTAQSAFENVTIGAPTQITDQSKISQNRVMDQTSKLGFKIAQDLGNGLTGLAQLESRLYLGNGGDNTQDAAELGSRNSFAGLSSADYGTVRIGRYDNAYKLTQKLGSSFIHNNINDASVEWGKDGQIMGRLGNRAADSINYESPKMSAFTFLASYNLGKDSDNGLKAGATEGAKLSAVSTPGATLMPQASVALGYGNGPITVGLGYTAVSNAAWELGASSSPSRKFNATSGAGFGLNGTYVVAQYTMGAFALGVSGENIRSVMTGAGSSSFDQNQTAYSAVGAYKSGPHEAHIRYAMASEASGTKNGATMVGGTDGKQFSVMYAYAFNDSTKLITSYTGIANGANAAFTSGSNFAVTKGASMDQFAIGLAVSF
jgi:predicted porin